MADERMRYGQDYYDVLAALILAGRYMKDSSLIWQFNGWVKRVDGYLTVLYKRVPAMQGIKDAYWETPRCLANYMREAQMLSQVPTISQKWMREQLIIECEHLFGQDGFKDLRNMCPAEAEVISMAAAFSGYVQAA